MAEDELQHTRTEDGLIQTLKKLVTPTFDSSNWKPEKKSRLRLLFRSHPIDKRYSRAIEESILPTLNGAARTPPDQWPETTTPQSIEPDTPHEDVDQLQLAQAPPANTSADQLSTAEWFTCGTKQYRFLREGLDLSYEDAQKQNRLLTSHLIQTLPPDWNWSCCPMLGCDDTGMQDTKPTLLISGCPAKRKKRIEAAIREAVGMRKIDTKKTQVKCERGYLKPLGSIEISSVVEGSSDADIFNKYQCGIRVEAYDTIQDWPVYLGSAVIGGVISVDGVLYGLTVYHILDNHLDRHPRSLRDLVYEQSESGSDSEESDLDTSEEDESKFSAVAGQHRSGKSHIEVSLIQGKKPRRNCKWRAGSGAGRTSQSSKEDPCPYVLDWAIVELPSDGTFDNPIVSLKDGTQIPVQLPLSNSSTVGEPQPVSIIVEGEVTCTGVTEPTAAFIHLGGLRLSGMTRVVRLDGKKRLHPGSSGSWVINSQNGQLYGHVLAADGPWVYYAPIGQTLQDIGDNLQMSNMNIAVTFPEWEANRPISAIEGTGPESTFTQDPKISAHVEVPQRDEISSQRLVGRTDTGGIELAASIFGLSEVANRISSFIKTITDAPEFICETQTEIIALAFTFLQLQQVIAKILLSSPDDSTPALLYINELVPILTSCAFFFSALEKELDSFKCVLDSLKGRFPARISKNRKFATKKKEIRRILATLQTNKGSLNLMLSIYQRLLPNTDQHQTTQQIQHLVDTILEFNPQLKQRMDEYSLDPSPQLSFEDTPNKTRVYEHTAHNESTSSFQTTPFQDTLHKTRVYTHAAHNRSALSLQTIDTSKSRWSQLSGVTLSQISNFNVFELSMAQTHPPKPNNHATHDKSLNEAPNRSQHMEVK